MARKVYCENTSCKHHKSGDVCDTTVKIGSNGKCKSFEKGFVYYFHRVWDELGNSNYIDFVKTFKCLEASGIFFLYTYCSFNGS